MKKLVTSLLLLGIALSFAQADDEPKRKPRRKAGEKPAAATIAQGLNPAAEAQSLKGTRPNMILVMTDDQGMGDLSCMGNQVLKTPNIDKFYEMSTRFADFHVSPTCSPSRAAILGLLVANAVLKQLIDQEKVPMETELRDVPESIGIVKRRGNKP